MQALLTTPGSAGTARVDEVGELDTEPGLRVRTLEVGVCGTDKEICSGADFGIAPPGQDFLVLGHEFLGEVVEDGHGFCAGELVTAMVRRSCGQCAACAEDSSDACQTAQYTERGITRLHGFARDVVVEDPTTLIALPKELGRLGVLAEPASICARGIRQALYIGNRQVWRPRTALVLGTGAIGMLATYFLVMDGYAVTVAARSTPDSDRARLAAASGATYASTNQTPLADLGRFDIVVEAVGNAQVMLDVIALLDRGGVGCLLGLDAHHQTLSIDGPVIGVDAVLENRVLFGSVNAHRQDWQHAAEQLAALRSRWPGVLEEMIGLRVPPDRFADAFAFKGVKATLIFA